MTAKSIEFRSIRQVPENGIVADARGECRRETPVVLRIAPVGDGDPRTLVDGVVDLGFKEDGVWTVVDFKTDRPDDAKLAEYRKQVALYAEGIRAATEYSKS